MTRAQSATTALTAALCMAAVYFYAGDIPRILADRAEASVASDLASSLQVLGAFAVAVGPNNSSVPTLLEPPPHQPHGDEFEMAGVTR